MYRTDFWTMWEKARVGCFKRTALKHVYYLGWNRSPAQVGCMSQVLGPGALGRPRGIGWGGRWEGGSGWGIHMYPWLIHINVWQKPLQYCGVVSLQLIKKIKLNVTCLVLCAQFCLTLCDHVGSTPPRFPVHGILQARILQWASTFFSRESFRPRDQSCSPVTPALADRYFTTEPSGKPWSYLVNYLKRKNHVNRCRESIWQN